jgi:predicted TIM-barrel fold metal-dependent hydrolase
MKKINKDFSAKIFLFVGLIFLAYFINLDTSGSNIQAIDVHEHIVLNESETPKLIKIMDDLKISKMILLDTPSETLGKNDKFEDYDQNVETQLKMKALYSGRFLVLYTYPPWDVDGPNKTEKYYKEGIDGLKFYNGVITDLGPINSSQMYAAYQKARQLNLSVVMHAEALNEEQFVEFEQVLNDFPDVIFICPHLCGSAENLAVLDSMFAEHKNLYTDSGPWHRVGTYVVKNPEKFREFFIAHSDRIMFATDIVRGDMSSNMIVEKWFQCGRDLLEKINFRCFLEKGWLQGMHLPKDVLINIYQINPKKVYKNA